VQLCSNCHHPNPPGSRFCAGCGAALGDAGDRREERKVITVLFADLVGFTSRAEGMDVEDVRGMLAPYHTLVRQQLEQRRGTVEKFIGDAVMAVFGAPTAHEDDPERAVRAALAIREALAVSNERNPDLDLHVRIGVNTGEALVSLDARPAAGESMASGDVVNTAARLQTAAPIDGVVVGEATYRATRDVIEYERVPAVHAKGKAAPISCWRAMGARSRVGESRRRHDATPLIDRRREYEALLDAFERAHRNRSVQILTLVGVPGIGKSRLVRELFHDLDRRPELIRWREGRSPPYGHGVTFWSLGEIVKAEAGMLESHEPETAASKLAAAVAAVIDDPDEAEWVEGHLRALAGLEAEETLFGDRKAEAFAAWRRFIERLAERRATVLVFEDLHWADDALVDFIEHLVAWAADVQLLVLCTSRPELFERRPGWRADSNTSRVVSLEPLSEAETHELFDALLGTALLPAETRSALFTGAAGNPLYAAEFVRMLLDRGILFQREGEWILEHADDFPVPDSVLGIIAARLDAVPAEDKAVIQDASVLGKVFWPGAVAYVAERGRWAIEEALRRLEQRQLIRRRHDSSVAGDSEYVFEHALICDVAYRTILRPLRAEKHRRAAEWLSSLAGARRDRADTIAHHYVTALENAEASGHAVAELRSAASNAVQAAAERAGSLHSHAAAAHLWRKALELSARDDDRRPGLLLALGNALALADEPAARVLDEAASALLEAGDFSGAAEAESRSAWLLSLAGKPEQARERDWRALELVRDAPPSHAKALILSSVGAHTVFVRERRDEVLGLLQEALSIAERLGLREIEAEALQFVGMARLDAGDEGGVRDIERALAIATELNSPVSLSCYGNLADMRRYSGALTASAALHLDGERAAERFGIPVQVRRFRVEQAGDLYYSGDWDKALLHVEEYLDAVQAGSPHRGVGEARIHRGRIRLARGDSRGALHDAEAALEFARKTAEPFNLFPALAFHARASIEQAPEQTEASVGELLDGLAAGQPFWGAWSLPDLLVALAGDERRPELRRLLDAAAPRTRWYDAVSAVIDGDFARAADLYAAIGSQPDEAVTRLRAAEQALAAGNSRQTHEQLTRALAFFSRVNAKAHMRDAEMLVSA
jgi:class 3 adenylate cyclase/tetratricopeptide (TPR) repeat protein